MYLYTEYLDIFMYNFVQRDIALIDRTRENLQRF